MVIDKDNIKILLVLLIVGLGIGYAYINSDLNINGTAQVNHANWDVHWANIQITDGSVSGDNVTTAPTISNGTTVNFAITLPTPGSFFEITIDAVNAGIIDAMIDSRSLKVNGSVGALPNYLSSYVTYADGTMIANNQELKANTTETYKIGIKYRDDIDESQLPTTDQTLNISYTVTYRQATEDAIAVDHSFNGHSWETIINNIKSGNTNNYNVGDTKTVDMGSLGTHTIRIANKSTPSECSTTGFSQTACGFVLEFADIITPHVMNPAGEYKEINYNYGWNVDGWPASEMRTYVNSDIYNALPEQLKNGITSTVVVSGHGSTSGETNFTSTDKLYLLSAHEVWEDVDGNASSGLDYYDTAYNNTRQLDYYSSQNITTSNYSGAIKQKNGSDAMWWLRSARSRDTYQFYAVTFIGYSNANTARSTNGVSPAFRIG